jgi:hypothetical protein
MGLIASPTLIAAQSSVGWSERGVVTATNLFARSIGSAVGVAAFGALANASLGTTANAADNPAAVAAASHDVFVATAVLAACMFVAAWVLPGGRPSAQDASAPPSADPVEPTEPADLAAPSGESR